MRLCRLSKICRPVRRHARGGDELKYFWIFVFSFGYASITPVASHAGAWTRAADETYLRAAGSFFQTTRRFGNAQPDFEGFEEWNSSLYGEYGLNADITVFGAGVFKDIEQSSGGVLTRNSGIGDVDIGAKYRLIEEPVFIAVQGIVKLPFLYSEQAALPLGNGQIDLEGKLLLGKSLGKGRYFGLEAGYRYRADAPVDEFRYLFEYGQDLNASVYARTKLDGTLGLGSNGDSAPTPENNFNASLPLAFDLGRLESTLGYKFRKGWAAEISVNTNLYGDNTLQGSNYQFAIVAQF